jgi:hypothetical protein
VDSFSIQISTLSFHSDKEFLTTARGINNSEYWEFVDSKTNGHTSERIPMDKVCGSINWINNPSRFIRQFRKAVYCAGFLFHDHIEKDIEKDRTDSPLQ